MKTVIIPEYIWHSFDALGVRGRHGKSMGSNHRDRCDRTHGMQSTQKFEGLYQYVFEPILERFDYPENERKYAITYYVNGIAAVVKEWLKGGCRESKEDIAGVIFRCIRPQMT